MIGKGPPDSNGGPFSLETTIEMVRPILKKKELSGGGKKFHGR